MNAIVKDAHVQFIMFECYAEQTTLKKERRILKMIYSNPKYKSYLTELRFMAKSYPTSTLNKQEAGAQEGWPLFKKIYMTHACIVLDYYPISRNDVNPALQSCILLKICRARPTSHCLCSLTEQL